MYILTFISLHAAYLILEVFMVLRKPLLLLLVSCVLHGVEYFVRHWTSNDIRSSPESIVSPRKIVWTWDGGGAPPGQRRIGCAWWTRYACIHHLCALYVIDVSVFCRYWRWEWLTRICRSWWSAVGCRVRRDDECRYTHPAVMAVSSARILMQIHWR